MCVWAFRLLPSPFQCIVLLCLSCLCWSVGCLACIQIMQLSHPFNLTKPSPPYSPFSLSHKAHIQSQLIAVLILSFFLHRILYISLCVCVCECSLTYPRRTLAVSEIVIAIVSIPFFSGCFCSFSSFVWVSVFCVCVYFFNLQLFAFTGGDHYQSRRFGLIL